MTDRLIGLVAAPHTPFTADGDLNLPVIDLQAKWLVGEGVIGAFVCGTTGEGVSLTTSERMKVAERWIQAADDDLKVIVHVGHDSVSEACRLAHHARDLKPFAIAAMPPCFFKPATVDALVDVCAAIAEAAGTVPFYYYHIPSMSGVQLSMIEFLERAGPQIPTLKGIKFTHNDLVEYRRCLTFADGHYDIPFGRDEILLAALSLGAKGAVGSTYNYAAPIYHQMIAAFKAGDLETAQRRDVSRVLRLVEVLREIGEIPAAKTIMTSLGIPCGPPRLPLKPLTEAQHLRLTRFLATWSVRESSRQHALKA